MKDEIPPLIIRFRTCFQHSHNELQYTWNILNFVYEFVLFYILGFKSHSAAATRYSQYWCK